MIKDLRSMNLKAHVKDDNFDSLVNHMNLKAHVKDDNFDSLVNHIIEINGRIQKNILEGSLLMSLKLIYF